MSVIVVDNPLIRGVITALNCFARPSTPQMIVESFEQGWKLIVDDRVRRAFPVPARPMWMSTST